ncbi:streptogrisin C [Stackebrandtia albiflava]|uniref:Streptogrisin C n=1 Tax=Stackebrandtia albiflava TaxID=406432 RepID=A0A562URL6_9ACTN|nr:carbohydrate-binding protein [Stackebrandtia albiflava]TWJ08254.1 streptogrisin C [Stackebrandtia albiflava]
MNPRRHLAALGATALAATSALVLSGTTSAGADELTTFDTARDRLVAEVDDQLVAAMSAEFGLSTSGVYDRLATEAVATEIESVAQAGFGDAYAGTWVDEDASDILVAVTDPGLTTHVEALGATVKVVDDPLSTLYARVGELDRYDRTHSAPSGVHGWYADVTTNSVVVVADSDAVGERFARRAGVTGVTVEVDRDRPRPLADIVGGNAYNINGSSRCSVGFSATHPTYGDGFVTAGHCGRVGAQITGGVGQGGQFRFSRFPGNDWAWVEAGSGWTVAPLVNRYNGTTVSVANGTEAAVGASVCRSGSTTGWHCGTIQAKNQSVTYPEGTITGMTQTTVCAEPGDSGGSYISGSSAQGVTSGGSGNCRTGGTTFFEPLARALANTGTTLTVTGGNQQNDFALSATPSSATVQPGQTATVTVNSRVVAGQAVNVSLAASALPSGAQASFSPASISSNGSSQLRITTSASTPEGRYTVTVTGTGGSPQVSRTTTVTLVVGEDNGGGGTWQAWTAYSVGDTVTYGGTTYQCRISHTAMPGWEPPNTPALWQAV